MVKNSAKLKKGGIDTIVAFIIVLLPLVYVLIFMVATIYHFTVQMYLNQAVKEAVVMAGTYGDCTQAMETYLRDKARKVAGEVDIKYYVREFYSKGEISEIKPAKRFGDTIVYTSDDEDATYDGTQVSLKKADLLGIYIVSKDPALLGKVSNFNIFSTNTTDDANTLRYTAYREEIIRNDKTLYE